VADRRRVTIAIIVALAIALPLGAWLAFGYFGIQTLWTDDEVNEELTTFVDDTTPTTVAIDDTIAASPTDPIDQTTAPVAGGDAVRVATGTFSGVAGHRADGTANLIANPDGSHILQFPDLDVENGPDLVVWLSVGGSDEDIYDLGDLKGNIGNQEYLIPADVDVSRFDTALVWCRRFSVGFGEAPLSPV
jgi:hypothetical protein